MPDKTISELENEIAQLRQAVSEQTERAKYYQQLVESVVDVIFETDLDGHITYISPSSSDLLGYSPDSVINKHFSFLVIPEDQNIAQIGFELHKNGHDTPVEFRFRHADGHPVWISILGKPVADINGHKFRGVFRDISDKKQTEQDLEQTLIKLEKVQKAAQLGAWEWDLVNNTILWADDVIREILGFGEEDLSLEMVEKSVHPDDLDRVWKSDIEAIKNKKPANLEYRIIRTNREVKWVLAQGVFSFNDKDEPTGYVGTLHDITERKEAEEAIRESEEKIRLALDITKAGIWEWNLDTDEVTYDTRSHEMLGYSKGELCRYADDIKKIHHPEDLECLLKRAEAYLSGQVSEYVSEHRMLHKDGNYIWVIGRGEITQWKNGKPLLFSGSMIDVTENKQNEIELNENIKQKTLLLRELYHRTKNNMQVIVSMLAMKSRVCKQKNTKQLIDEIGNKIKSMAMVHEKLYQSHDLSKIDLSEYIRDLSNQLSTSFLRHDTNIALNYNLQNVSVMIDTAIPLGLIINELITNAYKYAWQDSKTGTLTIELKQEAEGEIFLCISDDGVGPGTDFDLERDKNLGLETVQLLGEQQLDGQLSYEVNNGLIWKLKFKDDSFQERV